MKITAIIVRVLMGLMFAFASVTYFLKLFPQPELTGATKTFMEGIMASVYIMTTVKIFELVCAVAFLSGRFVPLATVVIFPVNLNIFLYHLCLAPEGLGVAIPLMLGNLFLAYYYRDNYKAMLSAK